jgi:predicted ATPase/class 3 adenylate cyclase
MAVQPTGTVTLLFTDIEGSTRLLERLGPERYRDALDLHRRLLRKTFRRHGGYEVDCEGDAFFVAFARAEDAALAAGESQQALADAEWPDGQEIRVRIGIHSGEPLAAPPKYVGIDVHKAARVMAAGHGGQVLLSAATQRLLDGEDMVSLGEHRLKDLLQPEPLYQLVVEGLPSDFPALKTLGNRPTNLPVQPNALIGRERELAEVIALLRDGDTRLVTLTGPGGTGKTRLALQVAAELLEEFPSGAFFISLAPIRDPALVVSTTAQTLGLREVAGERLADTLAFYLEQKGMLLVLDNFEHVLGAAADVSALLQRCERLNLLVTSRERLRLRGERMYSVPSLTVADPDLDVHDLLAIESIVLFAARAEAASGEFVLDETNASAVAGICARLDGLPLAIELAAARTNALPPHALLGRLDERLALLTGGDRDAEERQRTLRATIDWSYELLDRSEKALFAQLSVFPDGCRLDAAETVCDPDGDVSITVFDVITSLLEKSLMRRRVDFDGEARYWMLETIREYAVERRVAGGEVDVVRRHAEFYFGLVGEVFGTELDMAAEIERLAAEHANLLAALSWAEESGEVGRLAVAVADLCRLWLHRGQLQEGMTWVDVALAHRQALEPELLVPLLIGAAAICRFAGEIDRAKSLMQENLRITAASGNRIRVRHGDLAAAHTLADLADIATDEGDLDEAQALLERGLAVGGGARILASLGLLALTRDQLDEAQSYYERALVAFRGAGHDFNQAVAVAMLAEIARRRGDAPAARAHLGDALCGFKALGDEAAIADTLTGFARLALDDNDFARAARLCGAATRYRNEALPPLISSDELDRLPQHELRIGAMMTLAEAVAFALDGG